MKRSRPLSNRLRAGVTVALFAAFWTAGPTATDAFGQRGSRGSSGSSAGASRGSSGGSSRSGSFGSSSRGSSSRGSSFGSRPSSSGSSFGSGSFRTRPTSVPSRPVVPTRPTTFDTRPSTSGGVITQRPATVGLDGARRGETIGSGSGVPFGSSPAGGVEVGRSPSVDSRPANGASGFTGSTYTGGALPSPADSLSPGRRVYVRVPSSYRAGGSTLAPATDSRPVRFQPESVRLRGYLSTEDPRGLRPMDSRTDRTLDDLVDRYGREPRLEPTPLDDERVAALERIATRRGTEADRVARERYGRGPLDRLERPNAPVVRPSTGAAPLGTLAGDDDGLTAGPVGDGRPSNLVRPGQSLTPGAGSITGIGNPGVTLPGDTVPDGAGNYGGQGGNSDTKSFFFGYGNGFGFGSSYGWCSPYWNSWGNPFGCSFGFGLSAWWYGSLWNCGWPYGYGFGNFGFNNWGWNGFGFNNGWPYYGAFGNPFLFGGGFGFGGGGFGGGVVQPAQPAQQVVIVEQAPAQVVSAPAPVPTQEEKVFYDDGQGDAIPRAADADLSQSPASAEIGLASERYLTLGDRAFRDERWADAVHYYTKATDLEPEVGVLYLVLSDALFAAGDYGFAAFAIRRALSLDPALVDSTSDKRAFYANPASFDQQLAVLERYVTDHPTSADARLVLALNQLFGGSPELALAAIEGDLTGSLAEDQTADLLRATADGRIALEAR